MKRSNCDELLVERDENPHLTPESPSLDRQHVQLFETMSADGLAVMQVMRQQVTKPERGKSKEIKRYIDSGADSGGRGRLVIVGGVFLWRG